MFRVRHPLRDFLAGDYQEPVRTREQSVQRRHVGEELVFGDEREVVAVATIPAHHLVHRHVPVGVQRMGVSVALEPALLRGGRRRSDGQYDGGGDDAAAIHWWMS